MYKKVEIDWKKWPQIKIKNIVTEFEIKNYQKRQYWETKR